MLGTITSFITEQGYGFIKGDDGRDYYFSLKSTKDVAQGSSVYDGAEVRFVPRATARGYKATNIVLVDGTSDALYIVPDEVLFSRATTIRGWEIIDETEWYALASSRDGSDGARQWLAERARLLGANGIVELTYYKSTGSEPGSGQGTHLYTIHNFHGRLVKLAKRSTEGRFLKSDLLGLNDAIAKKKNELIAETEASRQTLKRRKRWWMIAMALLLPSAAYISFVLAFVVLLIGLIFHDDSWTNYDGWLNKKRPS